MNTVFEYGPLRWLLEEHIQKTRVGWFRITVLRPILNGCFLGLTVDLLVILVINEVPEALLQLIECESAFCVGVAVNGVGCDVAGLLSP